MRYLFDLDGVLCENGSHENFATAVPIKDGIEMFNQHVANGADVVIYTARYASDKAVTEKWLKENGVNFNSVLYDKPWADLYIDDKASAYIPNHGAKLNRKKVIVCLSGGMDSYIAYHYAIKAEGHLPNEVDCIYFDIGHPYAAKEKAILPTLGIPYRIIKVDLIKPELGNVPDEQNYIIPGRNMIFASIAAGFGETVWIMGMKYENHHLMFDKNETFFNMATQTLSQAVGAATVVESPFITMTKTDIIQWALKNKLPHLSETTSCYNPHYLRCGYCSLCFKRWIAMKAAGVNEKGYSTLPWKSKEAYRLVQAYRTALTTKDFSHYQEDRIHETLDIMKVFNIDGI